MVLIIKRFVKIFSKTDNVPAKYKNLRKNQHVKTFLKPYPNIPEILVSEYALEWNDKIIIFHTKNITKGSFDNYRTPFRKIYYGTVWDLKQYLKDFLSSAGKRQLKRKHPQNKPAMV